MKWRCQPARSVSALEVHALAAQGRRHLRLQLPVQQVAQHFLHAAPDHAGRVDAEQGLVAAVGKAEHLVLVDIADRGRVVVRHRAQEALLVRQLELGAGQRRQLLGRRLLAAPALRGIGHKHGIGLRAAGGVARQRQFRVKAGAVAAPAGQRHRLADAAVTQAGQQASAGLQ